MKEEQFRDWLKSRGITQNSIGTRCYAMRTIEKNLGELNQEWVGADLDSVVAAGDIAALKDCLKSLSEDAKQGGQKFRVLFPESEKPSGRLASWGSWLGQYELFSEGLVAGPEIDFLELYATWDEFLETWPQERLQDLTLEQYTKAGSKESFTYWIEAGLDKLGSIWGGSAFKFGVYSRKSTEEKSDTNSFRYDDQYGWDASLGESAQEAFAKVKAAILRICDAVENGDIATIEKENAIWQIVAWKIAFHYQDRSKLIVTNIFKRDWLASYLELGSKTPRHTLYEKLSPMRESGEGALEFGHRIWSEMMEQQSSQDTHPQKVENEAMQNPPELASNLILYGPPGTGKTFDTAREAVLLCDGSVDEDRNALMGRYKELQKQERIAFVTFHQNYSYEDFVEGLRPSQEDEDGERLESGFRLAAKKGIFRTIAERAEVLRNDQPAAFDLSERRIFKISLGEAWSPEQAYLYDEAIAGGFVHIGDDSGMDWSHDHLVDKKSMIDAYAEANDGERLHPNKGTIEFPFRLKVRARPGDIVIVTKGNLLFRAIGEFQGDFEQVERADDTYTMRRSVKWLWEDPEGLEHDVICHKRFSQFTMYEFSKQDLKLDVISRLIDEHSGGGAPIKRELPYVLIIDEINRANVSKVFGELITLIEPDKRLGQDNELTVTLPYSNKNFGVPSNLHIIGTMNTADRSIALLDTALRRRFKFRELPPQPSLIGPKNFGLIDGLNLEALLSTMNERIEYLVDRDHRIGHAFFMRCKTKADVDLVMRDSVIPLLQEYFFEDWSGVQKVLGKGFIKARSLKAPPGVEQGDAKAYTVNWQDGGFAEDAYGQLIGGSAAAEDVSSDDQN